MNIALLFIYHLWACSRVAASVLAASAPDEATGPVYHAAYDDGSYGYYPVRTYATEEHLTSPQTNFLTWSPRCDDDLLVLITPRGWGIPNPGPMLLDQRGDLVWTRHFDNQFGGQAYDFVIQEYHGEDYLTFWLGDDRVKGHGSGAYYMLNSSYDIVHRVDAANNLTADLHEFLITPEDTALLTIYEPAILDLSVLPGYESLEDKPSVPYIWDCLFQEIAIDTQDLIFEWRASEHVDLADTYRPVGPGDGFEDDPFDWFHINSIEKDESGNYLISARLTHSIYYINGTTGDVIWTLGGKRNDFMDLSDGDAINFAWQHDARFLALDTFPHLYKGPKQRHGYNTVLLSLFDNAAQDQRYDYGLPYARGLLLEITYPTESPGARSSEPAMSSRGAEVEEELDVNSQKILETNGTSRDYTVKVIKSYQNPQEIRSSSQGSMQIISGGPNYDPKVFVGFGLNAVWTEFEADGTVLCDVHYGADTSWERGDIQSYRTYKFPWTGTPRNPPAVLLSDDEVEVFVSWNGATEVTQWILQCSDSNTTNDEVWEDAMRVAKEGFETTFTIIDEINEFRYLRVIALDAQGNHLAHGTSRIIDRGFESFFSDIVDKLPGDAIGGGPISVSLILLSACAGLYLAFCLYRRYVRFRIKPGAGRIMWRNGAAYVQLRNSW